MFYCAPEQSSMYACTVRYLDKEKNEAERELISDWFKEEIEQYGTKIAYMVNNFSPQDQNLIYAEDTTKAFSDPVEFIAFAVLSDESIILSQFGIRADADLTLFIHISSFYEVMGNGKEPKSGDLIQMVEYGSDRVNGRTGKIFEVTDREDEQISQINPLAGHYLWMLKCRRYEHSFEPNVTPEGKSDQVTDDTFSGILSGGTQPKSPDKLYPQNSDLFIKENVFNYQADPKKKTNVYGEY